VDADPERVSVSLNFRVFLRLAVFPTLLVFVRTIFSLNYTQDGFVLPKLMYNRYLYEILSIEVHSTVV
jgi:hypothetical protein